MDTYFMGECIKMTVGDRHISIAQDPETDLVDVRVFDKGQDITAKLFGLDRVVPTVERMQQALKWLENGTFC